MTSSSREGPIKALGAELTPLRLTRACCLEWLDRDADYPNPSDPPMGRVFMNRTTGEFIEVEQESSEPSPDTWLAMPIPDHGLRHKWFRAFLESVGREDEYTGSIGRWLKEHGSDVRAQLWSNFRSDRLVAYIIATCRRAGIDAKVVTPPSQKSRHADMP